MTTATKSFSSFVETRIKQSKTTVKKDKQFVYSIYLLLNQLKGHSLQDVLKMQVPQFYCLLNMVSEDLEKQHKRLEKAKKRKR